MSLPHTVHRKTHPAYPPRFPVPDAQVEWTSAFPEYLPVEFTHEAVIVNAIDSLNPKSKKWADPAEMTPELHDLIWRTRKSHSVIRNGPIYFRDGLPRNPKGRTGMRGRGLLGKYGPNQAADPLITRYNPDTNKLEMILVQRGDTRDWAIPGGMVDDGEKVTDTLKREFMEEALNAPNPGKMAQAIEELFNYGGTEVYRGYVDDPRNTDESWMETTCFHFPIPKGHMLEGMKLKAGDDAIRVKWVELDANTLKHLYASHADLIYHAMLKDPVTYADELTLWNEIV